MNIGHDGSLDLVARPWDGHDPNPLVYLNRGQGTYNQGGGGHSSAAIRYHEPRSQPVARSGQLVTIPV